ncbi:MAG: response regulator [Bacteroidota bacterium]|nr:response regulator [Bacteroidota bacterium]
MKKTKPESILIVEDDNMLCTIFEMFIKELGYGETNTVETGEDAIEFCKKNKPDFVLMDIHLAGDLNGIQTAKIMGRDMNIPVIYISGDTNTETIKDAVLPNTYGFMTKPIHKDVLKLNIEFSFAKHNLVRSN